MKFIIIIIISIILNTFSYGQKFHLETFDSNGSLKKWKVNNNGIVKVTNNFTYNGMVFYKPQKDSFLILYDTFFNWNYSFNLSRSFKAIPAKELSFRFSLFSKDSSDFFTYGYKIYDKNKKVLSGSISFPEYSIFFGVNIYGGNIQIDDIQNELWEVADSIEINFHFNPAHPYDSIERLIVIDEIFFNDIFNDVKNIEKTNFDVFPNPSNGKINFKFSATLKPYLIMLYDATGKEITRNSAIINNNEHLIIENLSKGIYFIKVIFDNGQLVTKKIEIH